MTKNYTVNNLADHLFDNNILQNKINNSPQIPNKNKIVFSNMNSIYPNNQKLLNYQQISQKNNLNIMINNPNNINIKKINNNMNNMYTTPIQINQYMNQPNNAKNIYPSHYVYTGNNNMGNMPRKMVLNNPNFNYGTVMQPKVQVNNYQNRNIQSRFNNNAINSGNLQNLKINNNNNYQMFKYQ